LLKQRHRPTDQPAISLKEAQQQIQGKWDSGRRAAASRANGGKKRIGVDAAILGQAATLALVNGASSTTRSSGSKAVRSPCSAGE
jgi:hypothetical protein